MVWVAVFVQIIPCAGSALIKDVTVFLEYYDAPEAALRAAASCKVKLHPCQTHVSGCPTVLSVVRPATMLSVLAREVATLLRVWRPRLVL